MTPTTLLLNADFRSLSPNTYSDDSLFTAFQIQKLGGSASINRLTTKVWGHTFEGYVQGPEARCGTLFDALDGSNVSGLVIEGYRANALGDQSWAALPVTNGTAAWTTGPTAVNTSPARGFVLQSTAAGDCYIQLAGPFPLLANSQVALSYALLGNDALIGFNVDGGGIVSLAGDTRAWVWNVVTVSTGAAPANFRIGFTAIGAGETRVFAFPQAELESGTSPILDGARAPETLAAPMAQLLENGRLSIEWDLVPEVEYYQSTTPDVELLYADATNHVRLAYDPAALPFPAYRMEVTINGQTVQSDPIGWLRGVRLRLFLVCGNGPAKLAFAFGNDSPVCSSGAFVGTQGPWSAALYGKLMGRDDITVRQLSSVVLAIRCYQNGDRPDWVGCVCG